MTHTTAWGWWAQRGAFALRGHTCQWYAAARVTRAPALHVTAEATYDLVGAGDLPEHPTAEGWGRSWLWGLALGWLELELVAFTLPEVEA